MSSLVFGKGWTIARRVFGATSKAALTIAMRGAQNGGSRFLSDGVVSPTFRDDSSTPVKCKDYERAIETLNGLQTFINVPKGGHKQSAGIIQLMEQWLECLGYSTADLDRLRAVHVSGTKGKGSTCAFTESMLRRQGLNTGLFTSPHLRQARERIRLNGSPLSTQSFASYFWSVHRRLQENSKLPLPGYFHFLTLMAFDIFLKEGVDVAVVEVGIGGEYDATNVLRKPVVCGVSALGMDHISILGDTIAKIAWHKAGIFKPGVPAFTVPQPEEAMQVLVERAAKAECSLSIVPPYESYWNSSPSLNNGDLRQLGLNGDVQHKNASLALQLVNLWISARNESFSPTSASSFKGSAMLATAFSPSAAMAAGLKACRWPGRYQRIDSSPFTYWIDGAHTAESIHLCAEWFFANTNTNNHNSSSLPNVLIFNTTGPRNAEDFLTDLMSQSQKTKPFMMAIFCPTVPRVPPPTDSAYNAASHSEQIARCQAMAKFWLEATSSTSPAESTSTVEEAIKLIQERFPGGCQVLVTGSLHLIGSLLEALDEPVT